MKKFPAWLLVAGYLLLITGSSVAQPLNKKEEFTKQDTLRGSIGKGREWWDVLYYGLSVIPDYTTQTIKGVNKISFKPLILSINPVMQIDLQAPMNIDSIYLHDKKISSYTRDGNVFLIHFLKEKFPAPANGRLVKYELTIFFSGTPRKAVMPPWDGGWIWQKDKNGNPWMSVACQGLGASVWYPCKDHQSDEPDNGASLSITVPDTLAAIGNGRLKEKKPNNNGTDTWTWEIKNPINNYNIVPYIGKYSGWTDMYAGEAGKLDCSYWVLDYNVERAKKQFERDVHPMLKAFEYWFGPYPFYEDGFKLVESPHLGMEHQSAIAYGNQYRNGYLGADLSQSGWGLKWDFIIIHECGHEWFANNITSKDIADMWIHEGFTAYSETLFTEYYYGKEAGNDYVTGTRKEMENDRPVIGIYGVNKEGSGDMYYKGSNMLHTIRQVINNDSLFRQILRGLNKTFYHQTVTTKQVEEYFSKAAKKDLSKIFDQYLRTAKIPVLEYKTEGRNISYRWADCITGFNMPVKIHPGITNQETWIYPSEKWKQLSKPAGFRNSLFKPNRNFLIETRKVK